MVFEWSVAQCSLHCNPPWTHSGQCHHHDLRSYYQNTENLILRLVPPVQERIS